MNLVEILAPSCALFLDFDGTLVEIAPAPDAVQVPAALAASLQAVSACLGGALAIITGRPIVQIDDFLRPLVLPVAGVHGAERRQSGGALALLDTPPMGQVEATARALAARHAGLLVESKRGSVALHYRQAPEHADLCLRAMRDAVAETPGLTLLQGKMVVEAKPGGASKGHAIEAYLREPPFAGRVPVFIGDDITDEAGFSTVQRLGGMGIKVGTGPSVSWQRVADPLALRQQLAAVAAGRATRTA